MIIVDYAGREIGIMCFNDSSDSMAVTATASVEEVAGTSGFSTEEWSTGSEKRGGGERVLGTASW